jgi:hypothetical protein
VNPVDLEGTRALRGAVEAYGEEILTRRFEVYLDGESTGAPVTIAEFLDANRDGWDGEIQDLLDLETVGDVYTCGGGAQPMCRIVRATRSDVPLPSVRRLAVAFFREIEACFTAAELRECRRLNARTNGGGCHTHDHYDANMLMDAACTALGLEFDTADERHIDLWNAAWDYARLRWLGGRP